MRLLLLLLTLLGSTAWSQESAPEKPKDVITRLREQPGFGGYFISEAKAAGRGPEANALLHEQLQALSCDHPAPSMLEPIQCAGIASSLQFLDPDAGEGEAMLVRWVEEFLARLDPPRTGDIESSPHEFSPEYKAWSLKQGWSPEEAMMRELAAGGFINFLGLMGDPKLRPLFRRGVGSNSWVVLLHSTIALGFLRDKEALPAIWGATQKYKGVYFDMLLRALLSFDDPEVDRLILSRVWDKAMIESIMNIRKVMPQIRPRVP